MAKPYTFIVTQTDTYSKKYVIESDNLDEARKNLTRCLLNDDSLSKMKDTFQGSDQEIFSVPPIDKVETLFSIDSEDDIPVILISNLTNDQKRYLGI